VSLMFVRRRGGVESTLQAGIYGFATEIRLDGW
jgi:hypothetical protein